MKTSKEWWEETKKDELKLVEWLKNQYHGEKTAWLRVLKLAAKYTLEGSSFERVLTNIASQELQHAEWLKQLLDTRGIQDDIKKNERYWDAVLEDVPDDFNYLCGAASHAENMRLERIIAITSDPETPLDIKFVFEKIYLDEIYHAKAFEWMAGEEAIEQSRGKHENGLKALGLVI